MVRNIYVYVDTVFGFHGYFFNCLVSCLSMIVWTLTVLGVLYACVLYFCICTCSSQLSMFHMESALEIPSLLFVLLWGLSPDFPDRVLPVT